MSTVEEVTQRLRDGADTPVVAVAGLTVDVSGTTLLRDGSLTLRPGRITALTGPSGCGKTTLLRAVLGHLPDGAVRTSGTVDVGGVDPLRLDRLAVQRLRRDNLAYVGQDPGAALNPTIRVRALLTEMAADRTDPEALLARVALGADHLRRRPVELSGGEQRRVAIARALSRRVRVLIVDEPLAGLDPALRGEVAALLRRLADDEGLAIAVSGHDTAALGALADEVVDLTDPRPPTPDSATGDPALPGCTSGAPVPPGRAEPRAAVLDARGLSASVDRGRRGIVRDVDLRVDAGAAAGLIGASGAGKTTVARILAGLHPASTGRIRLHGTDLAHRAARRTADQLRRIAWVPQDPLSTLNPSRTVGATLTRPLARHRVVGRDERPDRVAELLGRVGLPAVVADRYPHELSGGQRQRVAIARALAAEPDVLICDEITSALDAGTAAAVMEVLAAERSRRGLALVLITHQMDLVLGHCETVTVLRDGAVIEAGGTGVVFDAPAHPATADLVASVPRRR